MVHLGCDIELVIWWFQYSRSSKECNKFKVRFYAETLRRSYGLMSMVRTGRAAGIPRDSTAGYWCPDSVSFGGKPHGAEGRAKEVFMSTFISMKTLKILVPVALLVVGVGCRSSETHTMSRTSTTTQQITQAAESQQNAPPAIAQEEPKPSTVEEFTVNNLTYTIKTIPNSRLTPTSREGDDTKHVYSSNIIAVYVHTNNNPTVNSINATEMPVPANNSQPQNK